MSTKKKVKKVSKKSPKKVATKRRVKTKKVAKKSVAKKRTKKTSKKVMVCVNGEQCFWTTDGTVISSLVELGESLENMTNEVFSYHVTKEKNDFADWVQYVIGDDSLASSLRKSRKPLTSHTVIIKRLKVYYI